MITGLQQMPQDTQSGLRASRFGRECARRLAVVIDARMLSSNSNECVWNGERVVIKVAHLNTSSVGVLYKMAERLDAVLGAFEDSNGSYRVIRLPIKRCIFQMEARPTKSKGRSFGKVGLIPRKAFIDEGTQVAVVQLTELPPL